MAKFGPQRITITKTRKIDSSSSTRDKELESKASENVEQRIADIAAAERMLSIEKNIKVMELALQIAEKEGTTYIPIPLPGSLNSFNPTTNVGSVREALKIKYPTESESGTVIRFDLFKMIIQGAVKKQTASIDSMFGNLNSDEFVNSINSINTGALSALMSDPKVRVEDYVNSDPNKPSDNVLKSLAYLAVATLSMKLLEQLESVRPLNSFKEDRKQIQEQQKAAIEAENQLHKANMATANGLEDVKKVSAKASEIARHISALANLQGSWVNRLTILLLRVAKAFALIALIHGISKEQLKAKWNNEVLPEFGPELADPASVHMETLYDTPDEDMIVLLGTTSQDSDKLIMEYCLSHIEQFNGKNSISNFTPWIAYVVSATKDIQLTNLDESLSETSSFSKAFVEASVTTKLGATLSPRSVTRIRESFNNSANVTLPNLQSSKLVGDKISKFFSKLPGSKDTFDVNIMDYIDVGREVSKSSSETSNYFMHLLKNSNYTPELVCCIINYILKAFTKNGEVDIAAALDFLKSMRSVLQPIQFNYGKMFQDILNRLFGDIKSKLLAYAISELTKFVEKQKAKLLNWMAKVVDDDSFTRFCTPLTDMVAALVSALDMLRDTIEVFLRELADWLLTFEIKINDSMLTFSHSNRNRLLSDLLDSLIFSLQTGKLCRYNAYSQKDIHPDAAAIIDANSTLPDENLDRLVDEFNALQNDVSLSLSNEGLVVERFEDPKEPEVNGPISIYRRNDGLSIIETIIQYSSNCNSLYEESLPTNLSMAGLDT